MAGGLYDREVISTEHVEQDVVDDEQTLCG